MKKPIWPGRWALLLATGLGFGLWGGPSHAFGPITVGLGIGGGVLSSAIYKSWDNLSCFFQECCSPQYVTNNFTHFEDAFHRQVFGQHLVDDLVLRAVQSHVTLGHVSPPKALVMSFHGWTGGGKNLVATILAESLYREGMASRFVHLFSVTRHFPDPKKVDLYKSQLQEWIRGNVTGCHQNLFIFDEIDKMPEGLIDSLKPFMDYYKSLDKIDYRRSIFLFLSNTGGKAITHKTYQLWKAGRKRTDFKYSDFEELISGGAFNDEGGFHHSGLITSSLIDYYIPFLPLEKLHVQKCAEVEALKRGRVLTGQMMARVIGSVRFWPEGESLYSENGCKQIYARVVEVLR